MTGRKVWFVKINPAMKNKVKFADDTTLKADGINDVLIIRMDDRYSLIKDVLYILGIKYKFLSIGQLLENGYKIHMENKGLRVMDAKGDLNKLGQGGFGSVYKGNLPDECVVAVKVLSESKDNGEDFINEVASIRRTSHVNIVKLLGFCLDGSKKALIYEFMSNGSLENYGMILEMVGRSKNIKLEVDCSSELYFPHWIYKRLELNQDFGLKCIKNEIDEEMVRKMTMVSLWCIQTDPSNRPSMRKVVEMLEGSLQVLEILPKPFLSSPSTSSIHISSEML
ncbi:LEAF RUST 10 DISEASE-RESISTANCE LOCUS RECEPTOR-LIKE PROTEIN KINASE-like 2.1 [Lathyrus oleraceus]|uniref:LEAF RUST 10 DISEASE-RESISTANCE LOCUS RECEPTOR-LIKE PROTEIN KINASE-like 2.1 n=1 Tax=Pisum sativum TaxID=3888 RepID=UPI0021CF11A4|nr:LEAF RUST 10 DISEASE-RESISTANCE LOCUS RECEPTOR-LIKE PROTEIN KINASE-like 2.1 [Pisum sativum]